MLRDFFSFIRAVWLEWKTLLTGGSLIAVIAIWSAVTGRSVPHNVSWLVLGLTLMFAAFFAWRKEWTTGSRQYIDIELGKLTGLSANRTSAQAATLLAPYIGKSIKITGKLNDFKFIPLSLFMHVYIEVGPRLSRILILAIFSRGNGNKLVPLPKGTTITVAGRISKVEPYSIYLRGATLLAVEDPSPSPATISN